LNSLVHSPMQKDPLLFIHGVCHGAWCWEEHFIPYFEGLGYECHTLTLPGHETEGSRKSINCLTLSDYLRHVETSIAKIGRPPILIGHSMGGMLIQKYLQHHSCKKAVLLAPIPASGVWKSSLRFIRTKPDILEFLLKLDLLGVFLRYPRLALFSQEMPEEQIDMYGARMCEESFLAYAQVLFPKIKMGYHTQTPMLVLAAGEDFLFPPKEVERTARKYQADYELVEGIGHNVLLDSRHAEVAKRVADWLEGN